MGYMGCVFMELAHQGNLGVSNVLYKRGIRGAVTAGTTNLIIKGVLSAGKSRRQGLKQSFGLKLVKLVIRDFQNCSDLKFCSWTESGFFVFVFVFRRGSGNTKAFPL